MLEVFDKSIVYILIYWFLFIVIDHESECVVSQQFSLKNFRPSVDGLFSFKVRAFCYSKVENLR